MKTDIQTDEYKRIGPLPDKYGHGPVTAMTPHEAEGAGLFFCLDCGYTASDLRLFAHNACDAEENLINQSWREFIVSSDTDTPTLPVGSNTDAYPIE